MRDIHDGSFSRCVCCRCSGESHLHGAGYTIPTDFDESVYGCSAVDSNDNVAYSQKLHGKQHVIHRLENLLSEKPSENIEAPPV